MLVDIELEVRNQEDETEEELEKASLLEMVLSDLADEYLNACDHFPDFRSTHEGVAIIEEEFLEFRDAAFWPHKHGDTSASEEVLQLAAMCVRFLMDVTHRPKT